MTDGFVTVRLHIPEWKLSQIAGANPSPVEAAVAAEDYVKDNLVEAVDAFSVGKPEVFFD